jgi:hypothetical protein
MIFSENQSKRGFFGCKSSICSTSGLSQICKIRNVWILAIPFSRMTLMSDPELWKVFLEFKNIILEEKWSNQLKNIREHFSGVRVSMVLELLAWISWNHEDQKYTGQLFLNLLQIVVFKIQEVISELEIRVFLENGLRSVQKCLI